MNDTFSIEQKEYLAGFAAGLATRGLCPFVGHTPTGHITHVESEAAANLAAAVSGGNNTEFS